MPNYTSPHHLIDVILQGLNQLALVGIFKGSSRTRKNDNKIVQWTVVVNLRLECSPTILVIALKCFLKRTKNEKEAGGVHLKETLGNLKSNPFADHTEYFHNDYITLCPIYGTKESSDDSVNKKLLLKQATVGPYTV